MTTKRVFETGCEFNNLDSSEINTKSDYTNIQGVTTIQKQTAEDAILMNADTTDINGKKYIASSSGTPQAAAYLGFDQDITSNWVSEATYTSGNHDMLENTTITLPSSSTYYGEWIQIQYPKAVVIKSYSITPDDSGITLAPEDFKLLYSSDGSVWSTADTQTAVTSWVAGTAKLFILSTPVTGIYFRLAINKVESGSGGATVAELILNTDARGQHWTLATTVSATANTTPSLTLTADGKMGLSSDQGGTDKSHYTFDGGITWFEGSDGGKRQHSFNHDGTIAIRGDQGDGMSRSLDGGITWTSVTTPGVSATDVRACTIARRSNFAFTQKANNAAVSLDGGDNFTLVSTGQNVISQHGIKCSDDGKYILISNEYGPYRSNDYGSTWTIVQSVGIAHVYSDYTDVSGTGQYQIYNTNIAVKISKDYGETFVTSTSYPSSSALASIISRDGSFIVVTENATTNKIHLSYDFGDTWSTKILPGSLSSWQGLAMSDYGNIIIASSDSVPPQYAYCHVYNNEARLVNGVMTIPQKRDNPTFTHQFSDASSEVLANLMFGTGVCRAFKAYVTVFIEATADVCENFVLTGVNRSLEGDDWVMTYVSTGDDTNMHFTISTAGQVSYSHTTVSGFSNGTISSRSESIDI